MEKLGKKLQDAVELTKIRLKKTNPEYEQYFDVFAKIRIESMPEYGYVSQLGVIGLNKKYIDLNSTSTISRLLTHEFIHYYLFKTGQLSGHNDDFQHKVNEVYITNGLKTRNNYIGSTGNMLEINAVCKHCGQEYHWSQARLARYKAGAKFYCHECYNREHKYYWLTAIDDIAAGQVKK